MSCSRTTRRPEWGSNPQPLDPESEVLTTRPPLILRRMPVVLIVIHRKMQCFGASFMFSTYFIVFFHNNLNHFGGVSL